MQGPRSIQSGILAFPTSNRPLGCVLVSRGAHCPKAAPELSQADAHVHLSRNMCTWIRYTARSFLNAHWLPHGVCLSLWASRVSRRPRSKCYVCRCVGTQTDGWPFTRHWHVSGWHRSKDTMGIRRRIHLRRTTASNWRIRWTEFPPGT